MSLAVEMRCEVKIDENHPIWPWMVTYDAMLHSICHVTSDGKTPWEKRKGRRFGRDLPEFAENIMYLRPKLIGPRQSCVLLGITWVVRRHRGGIH